MYTSSSSTDRSCPLEETHRAQIMAANDAAARRGLRVLAVAQRVLPLI